MEVADSSEMLVNFYHITWHHIPEDNNLPKPLNTFLLPQAFFKDLQCNMQ
jgi:hypothetical protein